ncbi:MAG: glycosyltransferase family 39 protein [Candidatus Daviesbacteria bacterium]|nr:glycosyltransferase family 39 protein [Candidatus Daviesbacteria bacterium]
MKIFTKELRISLLLLLIFFVLGLVTLPHYGINWDTINHLPRGQAYLHYFLTGKKDYLDLEKYSWYYQNPSSLGIDTNLPKDKVPTRSLYQDSGADFNHFIKHDGDGHPPLSDILSSAFNRILFGQLRLINDIDAYRVYSVLLAAILVGLLFYWVSSLYGKFAGLVSSLSLSLYPLFWAESHFNNEKDIPETVFFSFFIFSFWNAIKNRSWKWMITTGIFFGLALGTKFNIVFSLLIILSWLAYYFISTYLTKKESFFRDFFKKYVINKSLIMASILAPLIGIGIFYISWPFLWGDPIEGFKKMLSFYQTIGITANVDPRFLGPKGISTFPIQWIIFTTPIPILVLSLIGLACIIITSLKIKKYNEGVLFALWLLVPIIRVTWPGATIYGGVRQIMEYIPAMAILAGVGSHFALRSVSSGLIRKILIPMFILGSLLFVFFELARIHPNENVYFNSLIGGLSGAKKIDFPFWGNSFGSAYRQGIVYINQHAEKDAKIVYVYELIPNIPRIFLREDLILHNSNRSGYLRKGEYAITLTFQGTSTRSYYDMYLDKFIKPVFESKVDGVSIVKVWKNDNAHYIDQGEEKIDPQAKIETIRGGLIIELPEIRRLSRLEIDYDQQDCKKLASGYIAISVDDKSWQRLPGYLPDDWRISLMGEQPKDGKFVEPFVGQEAKFIEINLSPEDTCLKNVKNYRVYYFQ